MPSALLDISLQKKWVKLVSHDELVQILHSTLAEIPPVEDGRACHYSAWHSEDAEGHLGKVNLLLMDAFIK